MLYFPHPLQSGTLHRRIRRKRRIEGSHIEGAKLGNNYQGAMKGVLLIGFESFATSKDND